MITAVDTSALLSVLKNEPNGSAWMDMLIAVRRQGPLIACEVVTAEIAPEFPTSAVMGQALLKLGITIVPSSVESAYLAGQMFLEYRRQGGPRQHLIPDFLIAAHAQIQADQLAADDRGYLKRYFPRLRIIRPG